MMKQVTGFTLIELLLALTVMGLLSAIAVPSYTVYTDRSNAAAATADIRQIALAIERLNANTFQFPDSLDEIAGIPRNDPWGNPYAYLRIEGNNTPGLKGKQRKDKNLNPLNSDFDLYSFGQDAESKLPLTARAARDDVIRAGNGGFVGLAADH